MGNSSRFLFLVAAQLCVPAAIYLLVGLYISRGFGFEHLLPNYLFMAAPHILVGALTFWPRARPPALVWVLSLLNCVLVAFQLWVLLAVPPQESSLAWVLYIPAWSAVLLACAIAWIVVRYNGPPKTSSGAS